MLTRLKTDVATLKIAVRFATAVNAMLGMIGRVVTNPEKIPRSPMRATLVQLAKQINAAVSAAEERGMVLPTETACRDLRAVMRVLRRACQSEEAVPPDQFNEAAVAEHAGFKIIVFERLDVGAAPCRFQPVILKDDQVVRRIFVRSKKPEISIEHFAKRAIDHFTKTGDWPEKLGITIPAPMG